MKTELTYKQTIDLIALGVPKEKANGILKIFDKDDTLSCTCPNFKLEDFLKEEILPKDLLFDNSDKDSFMEFGMIYNPILEEWSVYYTCLHDKYRGVTIVKRDKELIDALYQLAYWYYENYKNN